MTELERAGDHEWGRAFIEHCCIFRSPPNTPLLTGMNTWQYYLPIATLNAEFNRRIGKLFWRHFADKFEQQPFQLCGCESGGVPLICALQAAGYRLGLEVNASIIKKQAKTYGIGNWLEGIVAKDMPVLLVDDVVGGMRTMTTQAGRLAAFGLKLYPEAFCVASCKLPAPLSMKVGEQTIGIKTIYEPRDFTTSYERYLAKYGKPPQFHGTVV
jgi:hypothetical protein